MSDGKIAVIILTKDEEIHISRAISSVRDHVDEIHVIDCYSKDNTVPIAEKEGAYVHKRPWVSYSDQLNWAISHLSEDIDWVLRLDADEYLASGVDLRAEIKSHILTCPHVQGILCLRLMIFKGKTLKHGGMNEKPVLRLFRRKGAVCDNRLVDEHIHIDGIIKTGQIRLIDHDLKGMPFWIEKHKRYADLEARQYLKDCKMPWQNTIVRNQQQFVKRSMYYKLPPFIRPILYFMFRYFIQAGFLDGYSGLNYAYRQALWYRLLIDVRILSLRRKCKKTND